MARIDDDLDALASAAPTIWGHHQPEMATAAAAMSRAVYQHSALSSRETEAARFQTAIINGCRACYQFRLVRDLPVYLATIDPAATANIGAHRGPDPDEAMYAAIESGTLAGLSDRERLAVDYARRIGNEPRGMAEDEAFWSRMHAAFSDREIVDLTYSVTQWIAAGRFLHVLELDTMCFVDPAREDLAA